MKKLRIFLLSMIFILMSCTKEEETSTPVDTGNFYKCSRNIILQETFVTNSNNWNINIEDGDWGCDTLGICSADINNGLFLKTGGTKCPSICISSASLPISAGNYKYLAVEVKFKDFILNFDGVYSDFEQGYITINCANTSLFFGKKPYPWDDYFILDMSGKTIHFLLDLESNEAYARVEESLVTEPDYPTYLKGSNDFSSFLRPGNSALNKIEFYSTDGRTDMGWPVEASMSIEHVIIYEPVEPCY